MKHKYKIHAAMHKRFSVCKHTDTDIVFVCMCDTQYMARKVKSALVKADEPIKVHYTYKGKSYRLL